MISGGEVGEGTAARLASLMGALSAPTRIRALFALVADGEHARVDGFTSLAVLLGALGTWLGYPILDPIAGLGITVAILFIVRDSARAVWRRMMDAIEPEVVEGIEREVARIPLVRGVESVRARWVGHRVHSEVAVRVPGALSVAESSEIKRSALEAARRAVPRLERLTVETVPDTS